jgi:hypothetical protein
MKAFAAHKNGLCSKRSVTIDQNALNFCLNRSTTFLIKLFRSLVTSDFLFVSNDIEHFVQVFGKYCAKFLVV